MRIIVLPQPHLILAFKVSCDQSMIVRLSSEYLFQTAPEMPGVSSVSQNLSELDTLLADLSSAR